MEHTQTGEKWTLIATILASSMVFIDFSALNVALPAIQRDLGLSGKSLFWIINAYSLFLSSLLLVGGSMGDIYGRKKIFIIGIVLFSLSSLCCGLSPGQTMLIAARACQGIGGALMVPGSLAIISALIHPARRGKAFGTWSTFSAFTTIIGPALGGWLADLGLWRMIFFINIPMAIVALYILIKKVPENKDDTAKKLDIHGAILATLALAGITYGFLEASEKGFSNLIIQLALGGGFAALLLFLYVERKSSHPMMPLSLFRSPSFTGVNAMTFLLYSGLSASLFFLPLNLIQIQGYSEKIAGLTLLPFAVILAGLSRYSGKFSDHFGARTPLVVGAILAGAGMLFLALPDITGGPREYWISYFPGIVVLGMGMGMVVAPLTATVMASVPEHKSGIASGVNNTMARTAGLLAIAVLGGLILISFQNNLESSVSEINIREKDKRELLDNAINLADTQPPDGLSPEDANQITTLIRSSFVTSFKKVMYICVALSWAGAFIAFFTLKKKLPSVNSREKS